MCKIRNDFMHLSYRVGRKHGRPPGSEHIPLVVFALSLSGAGGVDVRVHARIEDTEAKFVKGGEDAREWREAFYVPPGYFRHAPLRFEVKTEGLQVLADYRGIEMSGEPNSTVDLVLELHARGHFREDEEDHEDLDQLLSKSYSDHFPIFFKEMA